MKNKYILLDIDGVMVTAASWEKVELLSDGFYKFNNIAVVNLDWILMQTKANIVLISSHKNNYSILQWKEIFNKRLKSTPEVLIVDNFISNPINNKFDNVLAWVENCSDNCEYVIIDDDTSFHNLTLNIKEKWARLSH